jgi:Protein of unknown function (DUF3224)
MPSRASGTFDVDVIPQALVAGSPHQRMSINKQFHGGLTGTSVGEMLATATESTGARYYVAIERVTATLGGRTGSFVLMHRGTMSRLGQELSVTVAPLSGTGELAGISGTLTITIVDKQHRYEFEYALPET